jgi:hypothetical protein
MEIEKNLILILLLACGLQGIVAIVAGISALRDSSDRGHFFKNPLGPDLRVGGIVLIAAGLIGLIFPTYVLIFIMPFVGK